MSKRTLTLLSIAVVVLAAAVIGIAAATQQKSNVVSCGSKARHEHFSVTIQDGTVNPSRISGQRCDTITFTNKDNVTRELAFGPHEDHVPYDSITEQVLRQNHSLTITLDQIGTFHFHDHDHDDVSGSFSVSNQN